MCIKYLRQAAARFLQKFAAIGHIALAHLRPRVGFYLRPVELGQQSFRDFIFMVISNQ